MSNKPQNVVRHEHFFPNEEDREIGKNRIDVCELADGTTVIWDVDRDNLIPGSGTFEDACEAAKFIMSHMGDLYDGEKTMDEVDTSNLIAYNLACLQLTRRNELASIIHDLIVSEENLDVIAETIGISKDKILGMISGDEPAPTPEDMAVIMAKLGRVFKLTIQ